MAGHPIRSPHGSKRYSYAGVSRPLLPRREAGVFPPDPQTPLPTGFSKPRSGQDFVVSRDRQPPFPPAQFLQVIRNPQTVPLLRAPFLLLALCSTDPLLTGARKPDTAPVRQCHEL